MRLLLTRRQWRLSGGGVQLEGVALFALDIKIKFKIERLSDMRDVFTCSSSEWRYKSVRVHGQCRPLICTFVAKMKSDNYSSGHSGLTERVVCGKLRIASKINSRHGQSSRAAETAASEGAPFPNWAASHLVVPVVGELRTRFSASIAVTAEIHCLGCSSIQNARIKNDVIECFVCCYCFLYIHTCV